MAAPEATPLHHANHNLSPQDTTPALGLARDPNKRSAFGTLLLAACVISCLGTSTSSIQNNAEKSG
jgi:hypothetical protein